MTSVAQLGYLGFEVSDLAAWESFATGVLGLTLVDRSGAGFSLRLDDHARRFVISEGPADDLCVLGWQAESHAELETLVGRLRDAGVEVTEASAEDAAARGVERLVRFADPDGNASELCAGQQRASEPFSSALVPGGFVAGELGLGHCVLSNDDREGSERFYLELLGFRLSDHVRTTIHGFEVDVAFYHCNGRHHSLALGGPQPKRIHHFMIEAREMDAVGEALDRALQAGVRVVQTLGRHPNDRMLSFYALTPSGFQFEFGWGGRIVDDADWTPVVHDRISEWGHMPPQLLAPRNRERHG